jgi:LmbE family N-acetylglucosaminyl deacetylase
MRRLSAIFSHPDDETYATGGTLAKYAAEGVELSLYCATDGGAGRSSGIPVSSREELAALRRNELLVACRILGVRTVVHGGHPDGALAAVDPDVVLSEIVDLLRRERPDVVVTFGPEGAPTKHRDHRAISRLATAAFLLAGTTTAFPEQLADGVTPHRPARLCYVTWPKPGPGAPFDTEGQPIDIRVDVRDWHERKMEAFLAHRTQLQHRATFEAVAMTDTEDYFLMHGVPVPSGSGDLFAGLG